MPNDKLPRMTHHKASGQAVVRLGYRDFYLGPWGTRAARIEYDRVIAEAGYPHHSTTTNRLGWISVRYG